MQKGWLQKIVGILVCGVAVNVYAIGNGFYMGMMLGPATNKAPSLQATKKYPSPQPTPDSSATTFPGTTIANPRSTQFASRIYLGNQFNQYAAFELGATYFSTLNYNTRGVPVFGSIDQRVRDIDLVMKGMFPVRSFEIFGKAGIAATYLTSGGTFNPSFKPATCTGGGICTNTSPTNLHNAKFNASTTYKHKFSPTFSIGVSYDINQSWAVDGSYNSLQVGNNVGSLTYFGLGFSYHFTDKYCGQFLCDD